LTSARAAYSAAAEVLAAHRLKQPVTEKLDRLHFLCTDLAILQFVNDAMRHPERFPRLFPVPAILHLVMFACLEAWVQKYGGPTALDSIADLMLVLNVKDENSKFLLEDPTARTRKMMDALTKYVYGIGIRVVQIVKEKFPSVDMNTITAEELFTKASGIATHADRSCVAGGGLSRLHVCLEAMYDFNTIADLWEAGHGGRTTRVAAAVVELGSLLWSTPNDKVGSNLKLAHPKKSGEPPHRPTPPILSAA
jgi:hypothetical protein